MKIPAVLSAVFIVYNLSTGFTHVIQHNFPLTGSELTEAHMGLHIREPHMGSVWAYKCHAEFVVVVIDKRLLTWLELSVGGAQGKPLPSVASLAGGLDNDVALCGLDRAPLDRDRQWDDVSYFLWTMKWRRKTEDVLVNKLLNQWFYLTCCCCWSLFFCKIRQQRYQVTSFKDFPPLLSPIFSICSLSFVHM